MGDLLVGHCDLDRMAGHEVRAAHDERLRLLFELRDHCTHGNLCLFSGNLADFDVMLLAEILLDVIGKLVARSLDALLLDDDLILPESDITDFVDPTPPKKNKKTTIIILAAVVAFICLAGALIFVLLNKDSNENTQTQDTTEDSSARYDSQEFNKAMTLAEERLEIRDYVGVEYYTNQYSIPELMTLAQKYR